MIRKLFWGVTTLVGLGCASATGYLIVRGPFLDGELLPPTLLMAALGGFVAGLVVTTLGGTKLARAVTGR